MASSKQQNNMSELNKTLECQENNTDFLLVDMFDEQENLNSVTESTTKKEQLNKEFQKHLKLEEQKGKNHLYILYLYLHCIHNYEYNYTFIQFFMIKIATHSMLFLARIFSCSYAINPFTLT